MKKSFKDNIVVVVIIVFIITLYIILKKQPTHTEASKHNHQQCILEQQNIKDQDFYNSNEGFLTSVWGPLIWSFLHIISFNYKVNPSEEDKDNYRLFVYNLQYVLPCKYCRIGFKELLENHPLTDEVMESRESFSRWMYKAHNLVNIRTKKPIYKTYEEVRDFYENFRARCQNTKQPSKKEIGCVVPLYRKHKCDIKFIPQ